MAKLELPYLTLIQSDMRQDDTIGRNSDKLSVNADTMLCFMELNPVNGLVCLLSTIAWDISPFANYLR